MPTPRQELQSAVINEKIYVLGGIASNISILNTLEIYNATTDTWDSASPAPASLHHQALASLHNNVYVFGGYKDLQFQAEAACFVYRTLTDTWDTIASLPFPLGAATASTLDDKIYVFGGINNLGVQKATLIYNPDTNTWSEGADMPTPREHLASAVIGDKIYVVSGRGFSDAAIKLEVYHPASDTWETRSNMPTARSGIAAATAAGKLFVIGGEGGRAFDTNELYDPLTDSWFAMPDMPTARHGLASGTIGDTIYLIGGAIREGFGPTNKVEAFKTDIVSGIKNLNPHKDWLLQAFLNQNHNLTIEVAFAKKTIITLYDMEGKVISAKRNTMLQAGKNQFEIQLKNQLPQWFFLQIDDGKTAYSKALWRNY